MKRILVPTDLSYSAERGLQLAVEIAKRAKAEIYLTHFTRYPLGEDFSGLGNVTSRYDIEANLFNIELLQSNRSKLIFLGSHYAHEGVTINTEIVDDELEDGINTYIKQKKIDLIVIGISQETMKQQCGEARITTILSQPIICVRDNVRVQDLSNIVFSAEELKETVLCTGIQVLKKLAAYFDSTIHLVHVANRDAGSLQDLELYFLKIANECMIKIFRVEVLIGHQEVDVVREYANRVRAGLIATVKTGQKGIIIFSHHFSHQVEKRSDEPISTYTLQNA